MQHLYAPWRSDYVRGNSGGAECVFCDISQNLINDKQNCVLYRDELCFAVMNIYPYSPGHFMIIPHKHIEFLDELDPAVWQHISTLAQKGVAALRHGMNAQGVNIGMNIGSSAGAGIAEHLHLHVLPRWTKDHNFITTIGGARVYSVDFEEIYQKVKIAFLEQI
jgi:diadenosine tetraphosphate (Ap4A) HIT family hydrolase